MDMRTTENAHSYDAHADDWYRAMPTNPGHVYIEKPAMDAELPDDLTGVKVLSIGTGSGEELSLLVKRNPRHVVAVDVSANLLAIARRSYPDIEYHHMDMMDLSFPDASFGLVYSSLAFHYAKDWDHLLKGVFRVTKPGGTLLFSTHNPTYWSKGETGNTYTNERGVTLTEHSAVLPGGVHVVYYNHPDTNSLHNAIEYAGFVIDKAYDPSITIQANTSTVERERYENMATTNAKNPLFHIVSAHRPQ
jgi:ubiquinone/menaquinone biosynthesis C-methylase UbiE